MNFIKFQVISIAKSKTNILVNVESIKTVQENGKNAATIVLFSNNEDDDEEIIDVTANYEQVVKAISNSNVIIDLSK